MKIFKKISLIIVLGTIFLGRLALAGSLDPTGPYPESFGVTLDDIYGKIQDNNYVVLSHQFNPQSAPAGTFHTLQEIFELIPTVNPDTVISGTTILGVAGTYDISNLTPDKVREGVSYGTSSVGTLVLGPADYYLLEGFGDPDTNGKYYDTGFVWNGKKVFANPVFSGTQKCLAYYAQGGFWETANYYPNIPGSEVGGPRYVNAPGSSNPEDVPWDQVFPSEFWPLPIGTVTKVGNP
jgi:hypothetical protein